jgi:hypothetical protein
MIGRRGVSLIEILVLMTIGSTLMGIAVGSLHLLLKMDRNTRQRRQLQASEARLADQFRRDVHAALRMKPGEAPEQSRPIWQLELGADKRIQYQSEPGGLARLEILQGKTTRKEWYPLMESSKVRCDMTSDGPVPIVSLGIASSEEPGSLFPPQALRIDARLGTNHRFAPAGPQVATKKEGSP